jgi:hypothetical protein
MTSSTDLTSKKGQVALTLHLSEQELKELHELIFLHIDEKGLKRTLSDIKQVYENTSKDNFEENYTHFKTLFDIQVILGNAWRKSLKQSLKNEGVNI